MTNLKNVEQNYKVYKHRRNALPTGEWNILIQDELSEEISKSDEIVAIIVGGTRYEVLKKNFADWPSSRLSKMIRARNKQDILKYCDATSEATSQKYQEFYFWNDWSNFNSILGKYHGIELFFKPFKFFYHSQ